MEFNRIKVVAPAGLKVRKPSGQYLDEAGEEVVLDYYWMRRLQDGDVLAINEEPARKSKTDASKQPA